MKETFIAHLIYGDQIFFVGHETDITESKTQFACLTKEDDQKIWLNINHIVSITKAKEPIVTNP